MTTYHAEDLDMSKAVKVISSAQKFILPIPQLSDGEPLVYPAGTKNKAGELIAGQSVADWQGKPIGDNGIVFFNAKDQAVQAVKGDGTGVIIINEVTEDQARKLYSRINDVLRRTDLGLEEKADSSSGTQKYGLESAQDHFNSRSLNDLSLGEIKNILEYASKDLGLGDMYNSDREFVSSKMTPVGAGSGVAGFGLHKRDDRDICLAVRLTGQGEFIGPAATPQQFESGAVIVQQGDKFRLVQNDVFERTYRQASNAPVNSNDLPLAAVKSEKSKPSGPSAPQV